MAYFYHTIDGSILVTSHNLLQIFCMLKGNYSRVKHLIYEYQSPTELLCTQAIVKHT